MFLITGNRQQLSNDLCNRIKNLPLFKGKLQSTASNYLDINGVHIEGYPASGHTSAGRGKSWVSAISLEESSWWSNNKSEQQGIMDVIQGYFVKSNPYTLFASTPSQPGDLMDNIFKEKEDESAWRRIKMDYTYGENLIYTQKDLNRIRKTSSWSREMLLRWSPISGNTFLPQEIETAKSVYDTAPTFGNERTISVDPASGTTEIVVTEIRDGDIYVLLAEEKSK